MDDYPNIYHREMINYLTENEACNGEYYRAELLKEIIACHANQTEWKAVSYAALHTTYVMWDNYVKMEEDFTNTRNNPARRARDIVGLKIVETVWTAMSGDDE